MSGYVRIHRTLVGHPAFRNDAEAMAFAWLVAKAAWRTTKQRYKGHDIVLERGQLTVSIRDFAEAMDRPKGWAERLLGRLREHGMIEQKNGTGVGTRVGTHGGTDGGTPASVTTICNYDDYQGDGLTRETVGKTLDKTFVRQPQDTEQVREEGKKKVSRARKAIPDDWQPSEFGVGTKSREVTDEWSADEKAAQLEQFKANHRAKGNTFLDPQDAWQTWVLNTRKFGIGKPASAKQYVSASGYVYRGTPEQIQREAQRRSDNDTYWQVEVDRKRRATSVGDVVSGMNIRAA